MGRYGHRLPPGRQKVDNHSGRGGAKLGLGSLLALGIFTAIFLGGLILSYLASSRTNETVQKRVVVAEGIELESADRGFPLGQGKLEFLIRFDRCGNSRRTCVVDGDTFWLDGEKYRIADIDTPEISQPRCEYEKQLGERATERLIELLNAGPIGLRTIGDRDKDQFGRKLRVVVRDGKSLGDQLVAEGLARTWTGSREPWC